MRVQKLLKAFVPYGLLCLRSRLFYTHSASVPFDTAETIERRIREIRAEHGYVGLHMGCGPNNRSPGYLNCDIKDGDFRVDGTKPLPIPSDSLDYVYSEHFIEHITAEEALVFIEESLRVLKKGGIFRCLTPDLGLLLDIADNGRPDVLEKLRHRLLDGWLAEDGDCIAPPEISAELAPVWDARDDILHVFMHNHNHRYLWSAPHLLRLLEHVGFVEGQVQPYGVSRDERVCMDPEDRWGREWTSVVEACK